MSTETNPPKKPAPLTAADRAHARQQKIARLREQMAREVSREKEEKRRRETRHKIVMGAAVNAVLTDNDLPPAARHNLLSRLQNAMSAKDRQEFQDMMPSLPPVPPKQES